MARAEASINSAISKIRTLYTSYKIDSTAAQNALASLAIPADQVQALLQIWTYERAANIKPLTEAQIVDAFHYAIINQDQAQSELESLGYLPHDAWTLLCIKEKAVLPNEPAAGTIPPTGPA